ncbi:MAG: putative anti-sigma factor [Alphaproteobacteria bacterium]|nr:putative anti-sigma factor [Alphaproteobacteria bacterium]
MAGGGTADEGDALMREASAWFARMRGPLAERSRADFEAWLARGAPQRGAYNRAAEIFAMGKILSDGSHTPRPARARQHRLALAAAASGLGAVVAAGWLTLHHPGAGTPERTALPSPGTGATETARSVSTTAGESRQIGLADGSRVLLSERTQLVVRFTRSERRLTLLEGRGRFDVFHEGRPFLVDAGGGTVTARGTLFDVALSAGHRVTVQLIRGNIDVALPAPATGAVAVRKLVPGDRISFAARGSARPAAAASPGASEGSHSRDYEAVPLARLIDEANRASLRPIQLADSALAARRISGRFRVDDSSLLADRLASLLDLEVDRSDPARLVLRQR